ncbi:uncharacterized protein SCDLUD_004179 [Saccharomycodes ludwigii]|uniref:uncharacterized protein n=1 Tax=Saccharomycodes ludwigii TaxID=36035 RepID=UPI001E89826D|nr:hypothetical protein SCDLUD_004179 [Saccharomycodes ludwigii]KAH3899879.1 hypothetical protein SCDLUD_004179 [Saccharomycodes ludwigii]
MSALQSILLTLAHQLLFLCVCVLATGLENDGEKEIYSLLSTNIQEPPLIFNEVLYSKLSSSNIKTTFAKLNADDKNNINNEYKDEINNKQLFDSKKESYKNSVYSNIDKNFIDKQDKKPVYSSLSPQGYSWALDGKDKNKIVTFIPEKNVDTGAEDIISNELVELIISAANPKLHIEPTKPVIYSTSPSNIKPLNSYPTILLPSQIHSISYKNEELLQNPVTSPIVQPSPTSDNSIEKLIKNFLNNLIENGFLQSKAANNEQLKPQKQQLQNQDIFFARSTNTPTTNALYSGSIEDELFKSQLTKKNTISTPSVSKKKVPINTFIDLSNDDAGLTTKENKKTMEEKESNFEIAFLNYIRLHEKEILDSLAAAFKEKLSKNLNTDLIENVKSNTADVSNNLEYTLNEPIIFPEKMLVGNDIKLNADAENQQQLSVEDLKLFINKLFQALEVKNTDIKSDPMTNLKKIFSNFKTFDFDGTREENINKYRDDSIGNLVEKVPIFSDYSNGNNLAKDNVQTIGMTNTADTPFRSYGITENSQIAFENKKTQDKITGNLLFVNKEQPISQSDSLLSDGADEKSFNNLERTSNEITTRNGNYLNYIGLMEPAKTLETSVTSTINDFILNEVPSSPGKFQNLIEPKLLVPAGHSKNTYTKLDINNGKVLNSSSSNATQQNLKIDSGHNRLINKMKTNETVDLDSRIDNNDDKDNNKMSRIKAFFAKFLGVFKKDNKKDKINEDIKTQDVYRNGINDFEFDDVKDVPFGITESAGIQIKTWSIMGLVVLIITTTLLF